MKNLIITISRQYGSGGRQIGQQLAKELNLPFYDKEIIDLAAKESGLAADFIRGQEQQLTQSLLFSIVTNFTSNAGAFNPNMLSLSDQVYLAEAKAIRSLADKGSCVMVGRCADWVLEKDYDVLRVFVCAPIETRCKRAVEEYGDKAENIQKAVQNIDKQRARYCQHYCDKAWEDADNYDLCLNSGTISLDQCVAIIKGAYEELQK
jgi:cytidylate kinase